MKWLSSNSDLLGSGWPDLMFVAVRVRGEQGMTASTGENERKRGKQSSQDPSCEVVGQNQWYHFGVGAPPIIEPILVGIGMFTGRCSHPGPWFSVFF